MDTVKAIPKYNLSDDQKQLILREYLRTLRVLKPKLRSSADKELVRDALKMAGRCPLQPRAVKAANPISLASHSQKPASALKKLISWRTPNHPCVTYDTVEDTDITLS